jgi:hypothetical protein
MSEREGSRPLRRPAVEGRHAPPPFISWRPDQHVDRGASIPTGSVEPTRPGAPWWRYRRLGLPPRNRGTEAVPDSVDHRASQDADGNVTRAEGTDPAAGRRVGLEGAMGPGHRGLVPGLAAATCLAIVAYTGRMDVPAVGRVLIPAAGILGAFAFGRFLEHRHPDERWLTWLLVLGVAAKLVASAIRYDTLVDEFGGAGDASGYDLWGMRHYEAWTSGEDAPDLTGKGSSGTNWVRWFTGVVYYVFGPDMLNAFLVFALLAVIGSYLWYRATAEAVPFVDKRLYGVLIFFVPSIAFWPSSIGKEALMQLGIGVAALGTAHLLNHRLWRGLLVAAPGAWLLWRVRPHLLAFVAFAAAAAYLVGRVRRRGPAGATTSLLRPVGMVIVAFLAFFAANEGAEFLGMEKFSINAVESELNEQTERSSEGGSEFDTGGSSLTPLSLPQGAVTVLLRPFPWEIETNLQILASLEGAAIAVFLLYRLRSLSVSIVRARSTPFLLYCWTLVMLYAVAFSSFANFGLLVRQRSLVLPALFVLAAIDPRLAPTDRTEDASRARTRGVVA